MESVHLYRAYVLLVEIMDAIFHTIPQEYILPSIQHSKQIHRGPDISEHGRASLHPFLEVGLPRHRLVTVECVTLDVPF